MKTFEELVGEKIGEASMCWSKTPKGVFDSAKAMSIVKDIVKFHDGMKKLEDFIADLDAVQNSDSTFTELRIILKADGDRRKLWSDLHLNKYPGDY